MDDPIYQRYCWIVADLEGKFRPGRLPAIRRMTERWECTIGTVQRAYQELAREGLVVSRAGQGTHVIKAPIPVEDDALRRAALVHRSEAYLLETLTAGYSPAEIQAAILQAMERWQVIVQQQSLPEEHTLHFAGSHDPALAWRRIYEIMPNFN
jgi:DNA-binding transcriptional regulator YhcF (GntR family)